ncbi:hypothetical protein RFH95_08635 [Acinetobacter nosocomialis]|uniref:hypothetical protein n=1 Tax=Acinetobacter nosocomialis TaxID=106654 RepID=UPI000B3D9FF9|nr:hypothetical protein [Acinetobacter nosocomialis]OUT26356.1 hypothetical protein H125_11818 [Acinetobacter nosocomialis P020]MBD0446247.1 hypothetical protein [Acinetobacter nosocomialis]MBO8216130.1 hypothetical protein [Acinetobacter nosocomialis]MDQ9040491.1 hypothetical protein [Acinetobacter nosocomialis]PSE13906.1 hypothetical protein C7G95_14365 [Acinetobacter nosocomialis]
MKLRFFILGLLICTNTTAAPNTSFEDEYYSLLEKFHIAQAQRDAFIKKNANKNLTSSQRKKLDSIECSYMQSELQYNEFLISRFKEYKTFMKRSGLVVAADKELIQMDIDSLKEEINGPNGKCK